MSRRKRSTPRAKPQIEPRSLGERIEQLYKEHVVPNPAQWKRVRAEIPSIGGFWALFQFMSRAPTFGAIWLFAATGVSIVEMRLFIGRLRTVRKARREGKRSFIWTINGASLVL